MIGSVTERLAPDSDFMMPGNDTNITILDTVGRDAERVKIAATVTFLSGIFQVGSLGIVQYVALKVCMWLSVYVVSVFVVAPWFGSVWFCGDLSLRAIGESLHDCSCHPRYRLPA